MAQIGDTGAAQLAEPRERDRVSTRVEQHVHAVATALQWRAVMRRAQKDERTQRTHPSLSGRLARGTRAADDEPAHAVADEHQVAHRNGPRRDHPLEQHRELCAVGRNVASAVVPEVDDIGLQVLSEALSVIVLLPIPHRVAHTEPVCHDDDAIPRLRHDPCDFGAG
jgi:hypothetical protein